jgi:hypothetical protein
MIYLWNYFQEPIKVPVLKAYKWTVASATRCGPGLHGTLMQTSNVLQSSVDATHEAYFPKWPLRDDEHCPSSGILNTRKHNVSENGYFRNLPPSEERRRVAPVRNDISEERIAYIIRVKESAS